MLRWSGILSVVVAAVLVGVLAQRTHSAEIVGTILDLPHRRLPGVFGDLSPDGRLTLCVGNPTQKPRGTPLTWPEEEKLLNAGLTRNGIDLVKDDGSSFWVWEFEIPEDVARTVEAGDGAVIRGRCISLPGEQGDQIRFLRYEFRRGTRSTWSGGERENWKFLLAYGLAGVGPILLWAIGSGVALLCGFNRVRRELAA
jgi:hypothetical protein